MAMSAERKAERAAERAYERLMSSLCPIAKNVKIETYCSTESLSTVSVALPNGVSLQGLLRDVNPVLKDLGYRPVRITTNILNKDAGHWCIDINTPCYCDPGYESYHSM